MTKIQLGRTREVTNSLKKWYNEEKKNADEDWWWGFNKRKIQDIIASRTEIPFRSFFVRYLLSIHFDIFHPLMFNNLEGSQWLNKSAEEILKLMEETEKLDYTHSPDIIKTLTDTVFNDFISNGFYVDNSDKNLIKIRGSVNRGIPSRGKREVRPNLWDQNDLLRKIKARRISSDLN